MSRGNGGQDIFLDDRDRRRFLRLLAIAKARTPFRLFAYSLMSNHFHLLFEAGLDPLSLVMQQLLTRYAKYYNWRRRRLGHVFQSRYKALLCDGQSYFLELLRYIHLNPVRAAVVEDPAAWPWSGHRAYVRPGHDRLVDTEMPLSCFHADLGQARAAYHRFVLSGLSRGAPSTPIPEPPPPPAQAESTPLPPPPALPPRKTVEQLGREIVQARGLELGPLRGACRARPLAHARKEIILRALDEGIRPSVIAAFLGVSLSRVSHVARSSLVAKVNV